MVQPSAPPQPGWGPPPPGPQPHPPVQPAWGPPAAPPPLRNRTPLILAIVGVVVVLVAGAVVLVTTLGGKDSSGSTGAASSTSTSSSTPASEEVTEEVAEEESSSADALPADSGLSDELIARLPLGYTDCAGAELAGDGDRAAVECSGADGVVSAAFHAYPDHDTLSDVYDADTEGYNVALLGAGGCEQQEGVASVQQAETGQILTVTCWVEDGVAVLVWQDPGVLVEGIVTAPGTTQADLANLWTWWLYTDNNLFAV